MKLVRFYREGELSSIRMSNEEEVIVGVKNLFFDEQLAEEQIMLEIYSQNKGIVSDVDELRLDFDRIYSHKQLRKKALLSGTKIVDSCNHNKDFSIATIIGIKNEQRYLNASFRNFVILSPRHRFLENSNEPMLLAKLKNNNYYLLNAQQSGNDLTIVKKVSNWITKKIFFKTSLK
ncbi:MAG: hypothetical protein HUJ25_01875 [Crocinitomicaceae bacterium]|nr:hypothetical protein [Crocinitomicaceae bacterium]